LAIIDRLLETQSLGAGRLCVKRKSSRQVRLLTVLVETD